MKQTTKKSSRIVYVFIDASNLWAVQKTKGKLLDFKKLLQYLQERYKTTDLQVFYYDAYPAEGTRDYDTSGKHKFYTYLQRGLGITVRKKELKRIMAADSKFDDGLIEKGNMDVELTIDAVHYLSKYDTAVLFTGDSDFLSLVKFIHARDKKVYVFSSLKNVSTELRTGGDGYIDMLSIDGEIWGRGMRFRDQKSR
jgi:uncharacterized LabA/DUF88 family protein